MKISLCSLLVLLAAPAAVVVRGDTATRIRPSRKKLPSVPAAVKSVLAPTPAAPVKNSGVISISNKSNSVHMAVLCAMNSGFINGCFLGGLVTPTKQGVAAVTGAWTNSAIGAANSNSQQFGGQVAIIASFLTGSLIYGLICPNPKAFELPKQKVSAGLFLTAACLIGADVILQTCGKSISWGEQFAAMCLASVACGIQNSLTSSHSANLCRTTHFTGISSDMGTFLGQCLAGNTENLFKLRSFAKLAAGFWTGGFVAVKACRALGSPATPMRVAAIIQALFGIAVLTAN